MADLLVTIGADISSFQAGMQQAAATSTSTTDKLKADLQNYKDLASKTFDPGLLGGYNNQIRNLQASINRLGKEAEVTANETKDIAKDGINSISALGGATQSASMRFQQMRSGISAARDGVLAFSLGGQAAERSLLAMGHHITSLVNETGSFSGAMKALGSSLLGPGGIILAISLAAELWSKYSDSQDKAKGATDHFTDSNDALNSTIAGLDSSFADAVKNVDQLRINVDLAKKGFIDKNSVVKEYNDTMGKTTGYVTSLNDVENKLVQAAPAYIKMMLYKAAAASALKQASDKAVEAAKEQLKPQEDFKPNAFTRFALGNTTAPGAVPGQTPLSENAKQKEINAIAKVNQDKAVKQYSDEEKAFETIAKKFDDLGAGLAKQFNFNFAGDSVSKIEQIRQAIKRLQEDILAHPENKNADLLKITELKKQLDELNPSIKKVKDGLQLLKEERDKLASQLQDGIISGKVKDTDFSNPILKQLEKIDAKILQVTHDYDVLLGKQGRNEPLTGTFLGKERGIGQGADNGGLLDNSGVQQSGPDSLTNAGLGKNNDEVVTSMKKGSKAFQEQTEWAYQASLALKKYNAEVKQAAEIDRAFGTGLMNVFEKTLSGTQNFVSAMGQFLLQLVEKFVAAAAAAAVLLVLEDATGIGAVTSFSSIFGDLSGLKSIIGSNSTGASGSPGHYATGGIFSQATLGVFGERGPEAIVTPDHLADFAGVQSTNNTSNETQHPQIVGILKGSDLQLWNVRSAKTKARTS